MAIGKLRRRTRVSLQKQKMSSHNKPNQNPQIQITDKKALIIAQEIKFARLLANNDKRIRDKVLKNLKKWLIVRSQNSIAFTETDFMSLWKGLFYCMWMSDKMLIQEELAESLSKIVHCFNSKDTIVLYTVCALKTLATEWFGIDQYRLDKFAMLVRRILRQTFMVCKNQSWNLDWIIPISQIFETLFLNSKISLGFNMHVTEIYLEELAKVSDGNLSENVINEFVKPFVIYLITTNDERQMKHIRRHIFRYLIIQSDIGFDYMDRFQAWKQAGFPCTRLDDMEKVEISDTDKKCINDNKEIFENMIQNGDERPLDPRAGRVDVELPQIPFSAERIIELLSQYKFHPSSTSKSRRHLSRLILEFEELSEGRMPLGMKKVRKPNLKTKETNPRKAALRLIQFDRNLFSDKPSKKKKLNKQLININVCNTESLDSLENENILKMDSTEDIDEASNGLVDTTIFAETISQNTNTDVMFSKTQNKNNLMRDKFNNKFEITENKKKEAKSSTKRNKTKKMQLKRKNTEEACTADKDIHYKIKKAKFSKWEISDNIDQSTLPSLISLKNAVVNSKSFIDSTISTDVTHSNQTISAKKELSNKVKKTTTTTTNLHNSLISKKKVKIVLQRNTAQHTSEYIQHIRNNPDIPFDANRKPLASALKANCIPSPVNPFYRKNSRK